MNPKIRGKPRVLMYMQIGRVRTLTGKEIELDIEADYKVHLFPQQTVRASRHLPPARVQPECLPPLSS